MPELVALDLPGGAGFVTALQRVWDRGDAAFPLDTRLSRRAQAALLHRLRPSVVVDAQGEHHRPDGEPVEPGDALVVATSGTTGEAKGVVLTRAAVDASAWATSARLGVDSASNRWLACLPLCHVGGLSVLTRALVTGTPLEVLPGFDADAVTAAGGPDVFVSLVPTALRRIAASRFHTVVLGGSAPPRDPPPNVVATYGMTETGSGVVYDGVPLDGVEVTIRPESSEILVRGPMLLRAYRDGVVPVDSAGWLATGDAGWIDQVGRLHVHGRKSDLIITGGENVWPVAVESALCTHPGVAEAAVAGRPDPEWGERVVAFVVARDVAAPPALEDLRRVVAELVAPYASPRELVLVSSLPRTAIGKVSRDRLANP